MGTFLIFGYIVIFYLVLLTTYNLYKYCERRNLKNMETMQLNTKSALMLIT